MDRLDNPYAAPNADGPAGNAALVVNDSNAPLGTRFANLVIDYVGEAAVSATVGAILGNEGLESWAVVSGVIKVRGPSGD
jgi:hypothetical protein